MNQPLTALAQANESRIKVADLRRQIERGETDPIDAIRQTTLPITPQALIESIQGIGPVKAKRICAVAQIDPSRRIGGSTRHKPALTNEQRERLAAAVSSRVAVLTTNRLRRVA